MNNIYKQILIGTVLGLVVSAIGAVLYVTIMFPKQSIENVFVKLFESGLITKVITLGTLPNVLVFHLLIKRNQIYKARGVLMAVVLLALFFAFLKIA
ncbi:hypothetical protein [Wenyingzhuangia sp. 2_MG-2023]|uniref:hypothetical protein n=1 Tax=Wenyingzhuangia sp. 2_MG-2023 TaxID=3062639 RepID=UPI0026E1D57F|nr:hypothetical protein [Wenyingzhuangia sp. 2_MG-2023]MDO6738235.1 hypothetical protein [Wenyingzhuangia sp. 2_MG-2023]MDO6802281.1 hypothetical protein [Wenyingzhuangia sp. 1_MG-2023]